MTATAAAPAPTMWPYHKQGEIDYAHLDYDPNELVLKPEWMEQEQPVQELIRLLASRFTDFEQRPDTFLTWQQERAARQAERSAREAAETQVAVEQAGRLAERAARRSAEARIRQLEAELRRRQADR